MGGVFFGVVWPLDMFPFDEDGVYCLFDTGEVDSSAVRQLPR